MKKYLENIFGIDYRSLAMLRICLALIVLYDLSMRFEDVLFFFADEGLFTRHDMIQRIYPSRISLLFISGQPWFVYLFFAANLFFAFLFLVGKNTWWANLAVFLFNISLQNRNYFILNTGDTFLRVLLFWGLFLPLGAKWAADSAKYTLNKTKYFAPVTVYVLLQMTIVYFFTAILKSGEEWNSTYTAVYFALQIDQFATSFGLWAGQFYEQLKLATKFTIYWEYIGPFIAFIPFYNHIFKLITWLGFFALHAGIQICLKIGIFSTISMTGWMMYLPSEFWNSLENKKWFLKLKQPLATVAQLSDVVCDWKTPTIPNWSKQLLATFFFAVVLFYNICSVKEWGYNFPRSLENIVQILRIDQEWSMFSPFPMKNDGWFVMGGKLENKEVVNVYPFLEHMPVSFEKPKDISSMQHNMRWRKLIMNLETQDDLSSFHRERFAQFICKKWNYRKKYGERLEAIDIFFMSERTLDNYQTQNQQVLLWSHRCF